MTEANTPQDPVDPVRAAKELQDLRTRALAKEEIPAAEYARVLTQLRSARKGAEAATKGKKGSSRAIPVEQLNAALDAI